MASIKTKNKALRALHFDLFEPECLTPPAPATLYTKIREEALRQPQRALEHRAEATDDLPPLSHLFRLFENLNRMHFDGKLPQVAIEYSNRMSAAGSYHPDRKLIKIGSKYHRLFPDHLEDTLKHEMIHIKHLHHNAAFKAEANRIGASRYASYHPSLRRPPRYTYYCKGCGRTYPRQKILRMASCGQCSSGGKFDSRFKLRLMSKKQTS